MYTYIFWSMLMLGLTYILKDNSPLILGGLYLVLGIVLIAIGETTIGLIGIIMIACGTILMSYTILTKRKREFRVFR